MVTIIAWCSLAAAFASAAIIVMDLLRGHRQPMAIMNVVWPITALWAGPLALLGYMAYGRADSAAMNRPTAGHHRHLPHAAQVAIAATHCGSGCTMGDIVAECIAIAVPFTLLGHAIFGTWVYDLAAAFLIGIVFQYLTIAPMKHLGFLSGLRAALKADTASLIAWQVGMYGWMAIATFGIFDHPLAKSRPTFWFMMQVAMLCGFLTSYPVNAWLLRRHIKEPM